jgi:3-oxo-5-alpha-steroid 4-dehydrogenase 3 / polyprenol reductase
LSEAGSRPPPGVRISQNLAKFNPRVRSLRPLLKVDSQLILILALRGYFLTISFLVLATRSIPALRQSLIPYGKTLTGPRKAETWIQWLSTFTLPKNWFWHYYLVSVTCSVFCAVQYFMCSTSNKCMFKCLSNVGGTTVVLWMMMFVQGCRRLYESVYVQKKSGARMLLGHYLVGCSFYVMMNMAVFVEGSRRPKGTTSKT